MPDFWYGAYRKETFKLACESCGKVEEIDIWLNVSTADSNQSTRNSPQTFYELCMEVAANIRYRLIDRKDFTWTRVNEHGLVCSDTCYATWKLKRLIGDHNNKDSVKAMWEVLSDVIDKVKEREANEDN